MRAAFIKALTEIAAQDERVLLMTGDLGYLAVEGFAKKYPRRFFNVGVAEQNMIGLATGLAEAGFIPFVYSIVTFAALRPYEFIRNGPVQHGLPVRIVGVGGGMEYGSNGFSHYGLEDIAVMRAQPDLTVIAPADHQQTHSALMATWNLPGPIYYRLGKDDKLVVSGLDGRFELGKLQRLGDGTDLLIVAMGNAATEAAGAMRELARHGIACSVAVISCVSPPPADELAELLAQYPVALTVEAHYWVGGIGSLVAEVIADRGLNCRLVRCGVRELPTGICGTQNYLNHRYGISCEKLVEHALAVLEFKSP